MRIRIPNNWKPRDYQRPAWDYLETGGKHAELVAHRRFGKDDICLNWAACAAMDRVASYWHMLPEYSQARKAIWNAVDAHTGKRRIDQAFPHEIRESTNEQEMFIRFKNGSTWQVVGSDSYNSLVGAGVAGIVYSEWALANPAASAYFSPMLQENDGWEVYITTPRGKNHAYNSFMSAQKNPRKFAQLLTARDTGVFTDEQLEDQLQSYIDKYGYDVGRALFEQEYLCSFEAAILGAIFGREVAEVKESGRIGDFPADSEFPVNVGFDLGKADDTSMWFYQSRFDGVALVDFESYSGLEVEDYVNIIRDKGYDIGKLWLPHDARARRLGSKHTIEEQFRNAGFKVDVIPVQSKRDSIQAARRMFKYCYFDNKCEHGLEALSQYRREWDDDKKCFRENPVHDWTSHPSDAFMTVAMAWRVEVPEERPEPKKILSIQESSLNEVFGAPWDAPKKRNRI